MKYRLRRRHKFAFQNFTDSRKRAANQLPDLESEVVPHYSDWYEATDLQDLINQIEFKEEGEGTDEVLDEHDNVLGVIEEDLCLPVLVLPDGRELIGPSLRAAGDSSELSSDEYAKKMTNMLLNKPS